MSAKDDMINKISVTHNGAKIVIIERIGKFLGSPSATFTSQSVPVVMLTGSLCSLASITTGYSTVTLRVIRRSNHQLSQHHGRRLEGGTLSNPRYLTAKRAKRVQRQAPRVAEDICLVAGGDPNVTGIKNAAGAMRPRRTLLSDGVGDYSWSLSHHTGMVQTSSWVFQITLLPSLSVRRAPGTFSPMACRFTLLYLYSCEH